MIVWFFKITPGLTIKFAPLLHHLLLNCCLPHLSPALWPPIKGSRHFAADCLINEILNSRFALALPAALAPPTALETLIYPITKNSSASLVALLCLALLCLGHPVPPTPLLGIDAYSEFKPRFLSFLLSTLNLFSLLGQYSRRLLIDSTHWFASLSLPQSQQPRSLATLLPNLANLSLALPAVWKLQFPDELVVLRLALTILSSYRY